MENIIIDTNSINKAIELEKLKKYIKQNKHVFLFLFMDGCGHCVSTKESWKEIKNKLDEKSKNNNSIILSEVNKDLYEPIFGEEPSGFPTLRYIHGNTIEEYENDRSPESFVEWIENKTNSNRGEKNRIKFMSKSRKYRKTRKNQKGGKWSIKYKRSINCKRPRGFSQKQHCKYGRKHK